VGVFVAEATLVLEDSVEDIFCSPNHQKVSLWPDPRGKDNVPEPISVTLELNANDFFAFEWRKKSDDSKHPPLEQVDKRMDNISH
jgi:hypothetical protein